MPDSHSTPEAHVADLIDLLSVTRTGDDVYLGKRKKGGVGRVYGGQVVAQALAAAQDTVDPARPAHSLHANFMRAGSEDHEISYRVERDFDGGSFSTRRIIALQQGRPILSMSASFQTRAAGFSHQDAMPDVPPPEDLINEDELRINALDTIPEAFRANFLRERPIDYRPVDPRDWISDTKKEPVQHVWFRVVAPLSDDPAIHRAVMAYASDSYLLGTCYRPHGVHWMVPGFQSTSLDHALWLHEDARVDEWLLYTCTSPWAGGTRGLNHGQIFTRDGRLVASAAQEGLMRQRRV
jgi:acyl-CoA thioesterase II